MTANPALARMFGYHSPEELIASAIDLAHQFYVDPERRGEFKRLLGEKDVVSGFESEVVRKDGSQMWISENALAVRDSAGNLLYYEGTLVDITARKEVEAALREERNLLRTLIDNLPDRIYVKDVQGRKLISNDADWHASGGKSMEDVIGKTDFDMYPPGLATQFWADDKAVLLGTSILNREEPALDGQGNPAWNSTTKVPLRDGKGNIKGLVGIGLDITRQKQTEEELKKEYRKQAIWVDELEQQTRELALLNKMSDLLQSCATVDEAYGVIAEQAHRLFSKESGTLYIIGSSQNLAEAVATWGQPLGDEPFFKAIDCRALRRGRIHHVESKIEDGHLSENSDLFCEHMLPPFPTAFICVPLIAQGETLGVLQLSHTSETDGLPSASWYTEAKQQLAHTVADSLALALSNLKLRETLREQSIRDPLTGIYNRRYMEESLKRELRRANRLGKSLSVIMLDIDYFKHFNDMYGHAAGDAVLRELGSFLGSQIRAEDIACRYGGEEFALIMPDAFIEIARQRAEKIRTEAKHLQIRHHGRLLGSITLSLGVAEFPTQGPSGDALLRSADAALYRAKKAGRDQVVLGKTISDNPESLDV